MRRTLWYSILAILIVIGLCVRFYLLKHVPLGYYFDEMDYIFTGEAVARYGTDITGTWSPLSLQPLQLINNISELASVFHALVQKIFGYGAATGHLPSALFGIISAGLVSSIAFLLTKKRAIAAAVLATVAVSPWHIYISRVSYEGVISLTFQLLMVWGLMYWYTQKKPSTKSVLIALAATLAGAFFAYYTYHGAKFTVLAVVGVALAYSAVYHTSSLRSKALFILPVGLLLVSLVAHSTYLKSQGLFGNRSDEVLFNETEIAQQVDAYRKRSFDFPGKQLVISKPTVFVEVLLRRYLNVFDLYQWGITGEEDLFQFSLFVHGFIYISSIPLGFLGLWQLLKFYRNPTLLLLVLIAVAPVTNVLSNFSSQSVFRSALVYGLLLIFVGTGLSVAYIRFFRWFLVLAVVLIIESLFFAAAFFGRFPVVTADNHFFHEKLVAAYVANLNEPVTIITNDGFQSYTIARSIIYFNQLMPTLTLEERTQFTHLKGPFTFGNITLTDNCPTTLESNGVILIEAAKVQECKIAEVLHADYVAANPEMTKTQGVPAFVKKGLASPIDSRIYFAVYNDPLCEVSALPTYVYHADTAASDVLSQNAEIFCSNWMLKE